MPIKISVRFPDLEKEYDVKLPDTITVERLYKAIVERVPDHQKGNDDYELYAKHAKKQVYPGYADQTLAEIGIKEGETIIVKRDGEAGAKI